MFSISCCDIFPDFFTFLGDEREIITEESAKRPKVVKNNGNQKRD